MTNELTVVNQLAIMPVMDIKQALARRQAIVDFTKEVMVNGVDFGTIPGTSKDTLLKPGAEKLTTLFGLSPRFEIIEKDLDWTGDNHGGEPFFYFQYKCSLWRGDILAGEGLGSCNSWEKKYRYRTASITCPVCGEATVIKGKAQYGGGWLCWQKKGGCGAKWEDGEPVIENQPRGQVPNDNPADLVNTLDKMAQKRALVAATLIAVNASEFFTQDIEDMDFGNIIEGEVTEIKKPVQKPAQKTQTNGKRVDWSKVPEVLTPSDLSGDIPPRNLADFAVWYAARDDNYADNTDVVKKLLSVFSNAGTAFGSRAIDDYLAVLQGKEPLFNE